jgi:hypothetical protein
VCSPGVQEQGQPDFDGDVELRGEVLELDFFGAEHQAVVVEAYLAEGHDGGGGVGGVGLSEGAEGREHVARTRGVLGEGLAAAGVDADCAVEISCCWFISWELGF